MPLTGVWECHRPNRIPGAAGVNRSRTIAVMLAPRRMAAIDAQMLWMSAKIPNDQFLVYVFDGSPREIDDAIEEMRRRADAVVELRLRVVEDCAARYPVWVPGAVDRSQFLVHAAGSTWQRCLDTVAELVDQQLDAHRLCWRAHVFPEVIGVPEVTGMASVVVVQMVHALGDGTRAATLAGLLLGRAGSVSTPVPGPRARLAARAIVASAEHRRLCQDLDAGLVPGPGLQRTPLSINQKRCSAGRFRSFVVSLDQLNGPTVTVAAMVGISEALAGYFAARGEPASDLGAEVPLAYRRKALANNNFRNVAVGLHPESEPAERAERIMGELGRQRRRGDHPAVAAASAAFAAVPAPLVRWGVRQFDPGQRGSTLTGNTVVSSVNRGPANLSFGGCPVVLTAGFPGLSPMMSLTHGVHGIGDRIAISVNADPGNVDIDEYVDRLRAALM